MSVGIKAQHGQGQVHNQLYKKDAILQKGKPMYTSVTYMYIMYWISSACCNVESSSIGDVVLTMYKSAIENM